MRVITARRSSSVMPPEFDLHFFDARKGCDSLRGIGVDLVFQGAAGGGERDGEVNLAVLSEADIMMMPSSTRLRLSSGSVTLRRASMISFSVGINRFLSWVNKSAKSYPIFGIEARRKENHGDTGLTPQ